MSVARGRSPAHARESSGRIETHVGGQYMTMRWTIILAAAAFFAAGSQAFALDDTPDTTRIVSDPIYLPMQSQFYGASSYKWSSATDDVFDASGARTASTQSTGNSLAQQFQYGIT